MIFEPENWNAPKNEQMLELVGKFKDEDSSNFGKGSLLVFRKHLAPLAVYKYLVGRFGSPNGFQTFIKKQNDSDNLIHWDFFVVAGDHRIWFQGGNRDIHIGITGKKMRPTDWVRFANNLKADFGRCASEMATVGKRLQKWTIVSNRFALIADACAEHHEVLSGNQELPSFTPPKRTTERGIKRYVKQLEGIGERATRLFNSSLCLDLLTPVLAEGYINLLIFVMRKDDLKANLRQYDSYVKQPIDTRVFDLHLKCDHFIGGVDVNSNEYKNFKKVMDRRNHRIHGNIDPIKDAIETVYFDDYTPLYEEGGDALLKMFENKEAVYDTSGVLERYNYVHEFFSYLNSLVAYRPRAEFEMMLGHSTFGFDVSRQRIGQLFPSHEPMMLMTLDYDDELKVDWKKTR